MVREQGAKRACVALTLTAILRSGYFLTLQVRKLRLKMLETCWRSCGLPRQRQIGTQASVTNCVPGLRDALGAFCPRRSLHSQCQARTPVGQGAPDFPELPRFQILGRGSSISPKARPLPLGGFASSWWQHDLCNFLLIKMLSQLMTPF